MTRNDNISVRVTASSKLKQTLILARVTGSKQYSYITSAFAQRSDTIELSASVYPGKYVLAAVHEWQHARSGNYFVFLASHEHISLEKGGFSDNDFMIKSIFSMEESRPKSAKEEKEECTIRLEI